MKSKTTVRIRCLCDQVDQLVTLALGPLPVDATLCHCQTCRSTSGMLAFSYLDLAENPSFVQELECYPISSTEDRYFCGTCGTHLISRNQGQYQVAAGAIEHDGNVINVTNHHKVEETKDGGLKSFLPDKGVSQPHLATQQPKDQDIPQEEDGASNGTSKVQGRCHCGGFKYSVTHPTDESKKLSSPWSDLLVPFHSSSSANPGDVKWWLRQNDTKYLAGLCACRSCRLGAGFPIQSWAFIPKKNIELEDGLPLNFQMGTLKQFESSPRVYREFCGKCGATVFWHCDERPDLIDVSVGLLQADSGALAVDWLDWCTSRVSFAEEAQDEELVNALESGLRSWKAGNL